MGGMPNNMTSAMHEIESKRQMQKQLGNPNHAVEAKNLIEQDLFRLVVHVIHTRAIASKRFAQLNPSTSQPIFRLICKELWALHGVGETDFVALTVTHIRFRCELSCIQSEERQ